MERYAYYMSSLMFDDGDRSMYARALAAAGWRGKDVKQVSDGTALRLNGAWASPRQPVEIACREPRTGQQVGTVLGGGQPDAELAVEAASAAAADWAATPPTERADLLRQIAEALTGTVAHELATLTSLETGKRLAESQAEIALTRDYFRFYADAAEGIGDETQHARDGFAHHVHWQPVGVVAAVCPWNFPISIPGRKIAPALAAGCPVVLKPSEVVPRTSRLLVELIDAALPAGTLGMVAGDGKGIVDAWLDDKRVSAVSFTGSTRVGREINRRGADRFVPLVLELGGAAPFVVLPDAGPDTAVEVLMAAKYRNNGQSCIAANTAWVHESLYEAVTGAFIASSAALQVGDPLDEATQLGPLALPSDPDRLRALARKVPPNALVATDLPPGLEGSHYLAPITVLDPDGDTVDTDQELFGPVLPFRKYRDIDDVIRHTAGHRTGLGGYVVGTDLDDATRVASQLDVGIVGVNSATPNMPSVPFAGRRDSGLGIEGTAAGMAEFQQPQTIAVAHG